MNKKITGTQIELISDDFGRWEVAMREKHGDQSVEVRLLIPINLLEGNQMLLRAMKRTFFQLGERMNANRLRFLEAK